MQSYPLSGTARTGTGKKLAKELRKDKNVLCVLYGAGQENLHFCVNAKEVNALIVTPKIFVVDLSIDGKNYKAVLKDVQFHPVSDEVLHIDFMYVYEDKPIVIAVPVRTSGFSIGVKEGGKLRIEMRKVKVKALYDKVPDIVDLDVTNLGVGQLIRVRDLKMDDVVFVDAQTNVVASIRVTRQSRELEEKNAAAAVATTAKAPAAKAPAAKKEAPKKDATKK